MNTRQEKRFISIDVVLAFIISILSILTAYASYQATWLDNVSNDNAILAQALLTDSNLDSIRRTFDSMRDIRLADNYETLLNSEPMRAIANFELMSEEALASWERSDSFDEIYWDEIYGYSEDLFEEHITILEEAERDGNRAISYQRIVLTMAIALSFAAWASFSDEMSRIQLVFVAFATIGALIGLGQLIQLSLQ